MIRTKEEFIEYIDSFGKKPGEYTRDEIYQIGIEGKYNLSKSDKGGFWLWLADYLGVGDPGDREAGERLRGWVKDEQKRRGSLPQAAQLFRNTESEGERNELTDSIEQKKRELYIAQTNARDVQNEYRGLLRNEARSEQLINSIKECADKVAVKIPLPSSGYIPKGVIPGKEAVLMYSDLHIGMQIRNFANVYNSDIAALRLQKLATDTIRSCQLNKVDTLHIVNLGDLIHGLIHITGRISAEYDVASQIVEASELTAQFVAMLGQAAPHITYRSCTDNHSRMSADFKESIEAENFGRLIDFYLEQRLKDIPNLKFCHDNLTDDLGLFTLGNGVSILFAHGHRDPSQAMTNTIIGVQKALGNKYDIKYFLMGHYHSEKLKAFQFCRVIVNGSICGTDDFAYSKRLFGEPSQTLLIFDGANLIDERIVLDINGV